MSDNSLGLFKFLKFRFLILVFISCVSFAGEVYINRVKLTADEIQYLSSLYGGHVEAGRYWYDSLAGIWGRENGPAEGRAVPGIFFRGVLPADISGRGTSIFINGREIHLQEKKYLESIYGAGNVKTGRYWVNHMGFGGYEGGVAFFKIPQLNLYQRKSPFSTKDLTGGAVIGGGYIGADGVSVTCGSDGGCIY